MKKSKRRKPEIGFGYTIDSGPYKGKRVYIYKTMFDDNIAYMKYKNQTYKGYGVKNIRTIRSPGHASSSVTKRKRSFKTNTKNKDVSYSPGTRTLE